MVASGYEGGDTYIPLKLLYEVPIMKTYIITPKQLVAFTKSNTLPADKVDEIVELQRIAEENSNPATRNESIFAINNQRIGEIQTAIALKPVHTFLASLGEKLTTSLAKRPMSKKTYSQFITLLESLVKILVKARDEGVVIIKDAPSIDY